MAAGTPITETQPHIIERPRLLKKLDEAKGRLILLFAPAGYGKTTLARAWLATRPTSWYDAARAGRDIAVLASGLAEVCDEFVEGCAQRVRERLSATRAPAEDAVVLGDILAEDLASWPAGAWLAIDDYHLLADASGSDAFIETIFDRTRVNLLIATRTRPGWITSRRLIYGEAIELDQNWLRMNVDEAHEVLRGQSPRFINAVVERSQGWPAVLALAARVQDPLIRTESLPDALHDYFAEELFGTLPGDFQRDLQLLALVSAASTSGLKSLFRERLLPLIAAGLRVGFITRSHETVQIHPLLRTYLEAQLLASTDHSSIVDTAVAFLNREGLAYEAFEIAVRFDRPDEMIRLIGSTGQALTEQGKLTTLTRWVQTARARHLTAPELDLAEAQVALHQGRFDTSELVALRLARSVTDQQIIARAYAVAGAAAHLGSSPAAFDHFTKATKSDEQDLVLQARIGQFLSALEFKPEITPELIGEITDVDGLDAATTLRLLAYQVMYGHRAGDIDGKDLRTAVRRAEAAEALLSQVANPLARTAYLNVLGFANSQLGRYRRANVFGRRLMAEGVRYKMALMMPYANFILAAAALGRRNLTRAAEVCETAIAQAQNLGHTYAEMNAVALLARICFASGNSERAIELTDVDLDRPPLPALVAEFVTLRALILAATGDYSASNDALEMPQGKFHDGQINALRECATAIMLVRNGSGRRDEAGRLVERVLARGQIDTFVCAYRACPDILELAAANRRWRPAISQILIETKDVALAERVGLAANSPRPNDVFSPREQEVVDLLAQGLRNREIAERLFISEVTVKAHLRRAYRKLGVRSRVEALVALQDQQDQQL